MNPFIEPEKESSTHVLGIDIGSKGAIVIFRGRRLIETHAFPISAGKPDLAKLGELIVKYPIEKACIEDLHSIFGVSAKANFSFGWINGVVEAILTTSKIPYVKVQPKKWQKEMWEGIRPVEILVKGKFNKDGSQKYKVDTKATSLLAAKRLFPEQTFLATERSSVPHDGIVDACLIGEFCRRNYL